MTAARRSRARPARSLRPPTWSSSRPESLRFFLACSSFSLRIPLAIRTAQTGPVLFKASRQAGRVWNRAEHDDDTCQRELRDVVDAADRVWASSLEQAQAPALIRRVDALDVADLAAPPGLPADRLIQRPVHVGQLRRRQIPQVVLDQVQHPV